MNVLQTTLAPIALSIACLVAIAAPHRALGESKSAADAKALLEEAKKDELERKRAAKQTELDRLGEDLKKAKEEIDELEKTIYKISVAAADTTVHLDQLASERKRLTQDLDLTNLRIDAEKLKAEGLKLLVVAQAKARDALAKRTEEIDLRAAIVASKMQQVSRETLPPIALAPTQPKTSKATPKPTPKPAPKKTESQDELYKAEQATATALTNARQAMEAATQKLQQAEAAAAKAEKKRAEIALETNPSLPGGNDPLNPEKP
jgi:hypothetical protein